MANTYGEVRLVTYDSEIVTPQDDAILYQSVTANGVYNNFELTVGGEVAGVIYVPKSFAILAGRFIEIPKQELQIDLAVGTQVLAGQVYLKLDLSNTQAPCELVAETAANASDLTDMAQDQDINYTDRGVYMFKLGTFAVDNQTVYNPSSPSSGYLPLEPNIYLPLNAAEEINHNTDKIRELQTTTSKVGQTGYFANQTLNMETNKYVKFGMITVQPGKYLFIGSINYPKGAANNSTGWIYVGVNEVGGSNPETNGSTVIDTRTSHVATKSVIYEFTQETTVNLIGWHNAGATINNCIGYMKCIQFK